MSITSAARPALPTPLLGSVILVTGGEELLVERTIRAVIAAVRADDAEADLAEAGGAELSAGSLAELTSPSLFAASRIVEVRDVADCPPESAEQLVSFASTPADDVAMVLIHAGGQKGKGLMDKLGKAGVHSIVCAALKQWELPQFVAAEVRSRGGSISAGAATALVDAVGRDLRALAAAADQLVSDAGGEPLTEDLIGAYFGGRAEVTSFAVADAALAGRLATALEQLRFALAGGVAPVLVTSALASGLRSLVRFVSAPPGLREGPLAAEVGVPPWKLKVLREQARGWHPAALAAAIRAVALADAEVKGAGDDAAYSLERMVLTVTQARASS